MLGWLFGGNDDISDTSDQPYEVRRNGSEMHIIDRETGRVVDYIGLTNDPFCNPFPQDARGWKVTRNETYIDEFGRVRKIYGLQRNPN